MLVNLLLTRSVALLAKTHKAEDERLPFGQLYNTAEARDSPAALTGPHQAKDPFAKSICLAGKHLNSTRSTGFSIIKPVPIPVRPRREKEPMILPAEPDPKDPVNHVADPATRTFSGDH